MITDWIGEKLGFARENRTNGTLGTSFSTKSRIRVVLFVSVSVNSWIVPSLCKFLYLTGMINWHRTIGQEKAAELDGGSNSQRRSTLAAPSGLSGNVT